MPAPHAAYSASPVTSTFCTNMKPSLIVTKIWEDDDMIEVTVDVSDGKSLFSTEIYVAHNDLRKIVEDL